MHTTNISSDSINLKFINMFRPVKIYLSLILLLILGGVFVNKSDCQIISDELKKKVGDAVLKRAKDEAVKALKKEKEGFASADLNLAESFTDNSGMYENKEKGARLKEILVKGGYYSLSHEDIDAKDQAHGLNEGGEMLYASGSYNLAEKSYKQALQILESGGFQNTPDYSLVLSNLGLVYHTSGQYNLAEQYSTQAMKMRMSDVNDLKGLGASYNNIGVLYKDQGKYAESESYLNKALDLIQKSEGTGTTYAIVENNLAILFQSTGKYQDAEQLLLKALNLAGNDLKEKSPNYIRMKVNLALLYQLQERYPEAEKIYLDAIEIKKRRLGTNHPDYAVLLQNLASLYQLKGEYSKVESNLNAALAIYKKKFGEQHPSVASCMYDLARYFQFTGQADKAMPLLTKAIQIQKDKLGIHHPSYAASLNALAILYWQQKDFNNASEKYREVLNEYLYQIQNYFPAMSEYDKTKFWDKIGPRFVHFNSFVVDALDKIPALAGDMYNYHIATKAILFSATNKMKKNILGSKDAQLIGKYKSWTDLKEYLAKLYTLSREELKQDKINLDSMENASNNLEKELSQMSDAFSKNISKKTISWEDIASSLAANEGCVEIIRFKKFNGPIEDTAVYYGALILKKGASSPSLVLFRHGNDMENSQILAYRQAMQNSSKKAPFYKTYWGEIGEKTADVKTLYVSLDGVYNQISLNTLQKNEGGFLVDEKDIYYITNTNELIGLKKMALQKTNPFGNKKAVLFGNPNYARGLDLNQLKQSPLPELPGTAVEIQKVSQILKATNWIQEIYKRDAATKDKLRSVQSPTVLHIATHGFFLSDLPDAGGNKVFGIEPVRAAQNPLLRSGLMFTGADNTIQQLGQSGNPDKDDGILNAYEALMLNLENTELVVLSACETGLGETKNGEGVYGLQRAFRIAGTSALMISLWEVSDEVTQKLMTSFYINWIQLKDKHKAFLKAQLEIKAKNPEPFFWGAFILVGN
jgi:CHAT domain-containing protein/Tfp pilus assembly protein PilF